MTKLIGLMLFIMMVIGVESPLLAVNGKSNQATLKGIKGFGVLVENLSPIVEKGGVTKSQLQIEVEFKLREAGIKVLSREECLQAPGEPYLYINININTSKTESDIYPYSIDAMFIQKVSLLRNPGQTSYSVTWSTGGVGSINKDLLSHLRNVVGDILDVFIKAYLTENPR